MTGSDGKIEGLVTEGALELFDVVSVLSVTFDRLRN